MTGIYLANVLLGLIWVLVTGTFTLPNVMLGFGLGALALYLMRETAGSLGYFSRARRVLSLGLLFAKELLLSGWRVAVLVVQPRIPLKPGIFAYPLSVGRDFEITLLANLITLTPGTLSVDVSEDRKMLFVHAIDCSDPDQTRDEIARGFESKIMEAFR